MKPTKKAIGYIRVSAVEQPTTHHETTLQLYCGTYETQLVEIFKDLGVSRNKGVHPAWTEMIEYLKNHPGEVHSVVIPACNHIPTWDPVAAPILVEFLQSTFGVTVIAANNLSGDNHQLNEPMIINPIRSAIGYIRFDPNDPEVKSHESIVRSHCRKSKQHLVTIYYDHPTPAIPGRYPGWISLMEYIKNRPGEIQCVVMSPCPRVLASPEMSMAYLMAALEKEGLNIQIGPASDSF